MKYLVYLLLVLNVAYFAWLQMQPAPAPPVPRLKPLPSGVEPLVLLSERNRTGVAVTKPPADTDKAQVETAPVSVARQPAEEETPEATEPVLVCHTLGPLKSANEAAALREELSAQGIPAALRRSETQAPSGYQVYLQAVSSNKAGEIVRGLEAAGMTDYFVGKRNRISLGIFSSKSKAQTRLRTVRELGYDARLNVRYKTRKVYWIDIEGNSRLLEDTRDWQQVIARYPQLKVQQVSCE